MKYYVIRNTRNSKYFCGNVTTWYDASRKKDYKSYKGLVSIDFSSRPDRATQFKSIAYTKVVIDLIGNTLEKAIVNKGFPHGNTSFFPEDISDLIIVRVTTTIEEEVVSF